MDWIFIKIRVTGHVSMHDARRLCLLLISVILCMFSVLPNNHQLEKSSLRYV